MGKASGVLLIVAGVGMAAYLLPLSADPDQDAGATGAAKASAPDGHRIATATIGAPAKAQSAFRAAPAAAAQPSLSASAPIVVTVTHRAAPVPPPVPAAKALPPASDHEAITRELQKELRRVGCYDGPITGVWTPSVRQATKDFTDRVNATLPTDQPDNILLMLVQGHQDKVCGKPCPTGQGLSQDGRCLPSAILARTVNRGQLATASAQAQPAITGWSTTISAAPARPAGAALEGRMALAGPNAEAQPPTAGLAADPRARQAAPPRAAAHVQRARERAPPHYAQRGSAPRRHIADTVFRSPMFTY